MKLVIVESPSKAKTIGKYLGKDYYVVASYGHIRQLPSKQGSVDPNNNFKMIWEETTQAKKHLKEIKAKTKNIQEIYLATDPDREGEAISWHLVNYLTEKKLINKTTPVKRVVFNSITKDSIQLAFTKTRDVDVSLVSAYLTRLSLDYLVGFNISPILWRKLPGSKSAGRVQSVALRLVAERENAIEEFNSEEYWSINALLKDEKKQDLSTKLTVFNNKKLEKLDIKTEEEAENIKKTLLADKSYYLKDIIKKSLTKNPPAPFTTSSLQQDAFNKLGFSAKKTMTLAQKLYEGINLGGEITGLITYMRTDATDISPQVVTEIRSYINNEIGSKYLTKSPRVFKTKSKNAQEAHEAIRPSNIKLKPSNVANKLSNDEFNLYELIWNRTVASQMESAKYQNTTYEVHNSDSYIVLKANGSILEFDGFYKVLNNRKNSNTSKKDGDLNLLPVIELNSQLRCAEVTPNQHFTEPPPRYTEATLVKSLEELGIGRPSTYASIISVLINREYARIESRKFYLEERGRILNIFLTRFFTKYVDYNFTANLEEQLDAISNGTLKSEEVLQKFWQDFNSKVEETKQLSPQLILDTLNDAMASKFIGDDLTCPKCKSATLSIKNSKFGAFVGCNNYPDCQYNRKLHKVSSAEGDNNNQEDQGNTKILLDDKENHLHILIKEGPYGWYVEKFSDNGKTKKVAIMPPLTKDSITLDIAQTLLELPKKLDANISIGLGRFGPYLKKGSSFYSLKGDLINLIKSLTVEEASKIIQEQERKKQGIPLGINPTNKKPITVKYGRFGAYLDYNNSNIKIPKEYKEHFKSVSDNDPKCLEHAITIINNESKSNAKKRK